MPTDARFAEALARLPDYLGSHVLLSVTALLLGLVASLPLAVLAVRRPLWRGLVLALTSIVQTIPGLALLALFYPLLLGLAALSEAWLGLGFSALGFLPAVLALALYSMLPVLRNTITGLAGIDPAVVEAARGVGMTERQRLLMVDLPLALPIIMAGIRTAAVWVIGTATLATPIGQTSLGNYIFAGLQTQNWVFVLFGCAAAAILALSIDQLLALVEHGLRSRRRVRVGAGLAGLVAIVAAALVPASADRGLRSYAIGSKPFAEQYILAALIEQRLRAADLPARRLEGLGSSVLFQALAAGEVDIAVDYSGTIWATQMHRRDVRSRADVRAAVAQWLERTYGIGVLGGLGFENAYALAMPRSRAAALAIRSIEDLARHAPSMAIAGDYEFFARPEWMALQQAYGLRFRAERQMQSEFMYAGAAAGDVDVIAAYTSDGRIAQYDLVLLEDPRQVIPPYDAILLLAPQRRTDTALRKALAPLLHRIDVELMRRANLRVAMGGDGASPEAAAAWLWRELETGAGRRGAPP